MLTPFDRPRDLSRILRAAVVAIPILFGPGASFAGLSSSKPPSDEREDAGGKVLPARAEPFGYSLKDAARTTAVFNVGDHSGPPPELPFVMLYSTPTNTVTVDRATVLYVPVLQNDDAPPVIGDFPNVDNEAALIRYTFSGKELGVQYATITVDGRQTSLSHEYVSGATVATPDGGKHYMVIAAYLSPLKPGRHKITISALATGTALVAWCAFTGFCTDSYAFTIDYTVDVR